MKLLKISLINTPKNSETFHLFLLKGRKSRWRYKICIRPSPFIAPSKLPDVSYGLSEARAAVEWGLSVARKIALTMNLSVSPSPSLAVNTRGWFPPPPPQSKSGGGSSTVGYRLTPRAKTRRCTVRGYVVKSGGCCWQVFAQNHGHFCPIFLDSVWGKSELELHIWSVHSRTPLIKTAKKAIALDIKRIGRV